MGKTAYDAHANTGLTKKKIGKTTGPHANLSLYFPWFLREDFDKFRTNTQVI